MNPQYGVVLWVMIGALAGWIGSKLMGTDDRQGTVANIVIGIVGAIVGGFTTRLLFGDNHGNNGLLASFAVATFGACIVISFVKRVLYREKAPKSKRNRR